MLIRDAIWALREDPTKWARPMEWRHKFSAIRCIEGGLRRYNSPVGHEICTLSEARYITGEWEILTEAQVAEMLEH